MEPEENKEEKRMLIFDEAGIASLAKRFREIRKKAGLTQEQLAFEAGIARSQIKRIEKGETNPTVSTIFVVARALEIEPEEFFKFKLPPRSAEGKS